jgi:aconitate hydratase
LYASGFGLTPEQVSKKVSFEYEENGEKKQGTLTHGSVVIAAITSCTNTSNPSVMIAAGLVARNAVKKGLKVPSYIKTSLAPGSGVVTEYLKKSGLLPFLEQLGFKYVVRVLPSSVASLAPCCDDFKFSCGYESDSYEDL